MVFMSGYLPLWTPLDLLSGFLKCLPLGFRYALSVKAFLWCH